MQLKLMSFNVNGIRARPHQLEQIRDVYDPDIIGLQEIKVHSDVFPEELVTDLGWHVEHFGQKGHYGVALVSKTAPVMVQKGYPTDDEDAQRRFIHARYEIGGRSIDVMNGYFPQGESRDHPTKFPAKRAYYADLNRYVAEQISQVDNLLLMGDMNISPQDCDIGIGEVNAKRWLRTGKCSFLPEEREWYDALLARGLYDTYRAEHGDSNERFSWFDYRSKGFDDEPKRGLRIDHLLATKPLLDRHVKSGIAYDTRGMEKPSDHAPVWSVFDWD